jgi:four helix bundle protein
LWVITSGKSLGLERESAGYLVGVWPVTAVTKNPADDPEFLARKYQYRVLMNETEAIHLEEPVNVDHVIRGEGYDAQIPVGRFLRGPRRLTDAKVRLRRSAAGAEMARKWLTGNGVRSGENGVRRSNTDNGPTCAEDGGTGGEGGGARAEGGMGEAERGSVGKNSERSDLRDRTKRFALRIIRLFSALPKTTEAQVIGKQLLRSGTSVGAHYREAYRGRSAAEYIAKIEGGLQELEETIYWFELLRDAEIVADDRLSDLQNEADQLAAILVACAKSAKHGVKGRGRGTEERGRP